MSLAIVAWQALYINCKFNANCPSPAKAGIAAFADYRFSLFSKKFKLFSQI
jgi:hypothetical protein